MIEQLRSERATAYSKVQEHESRYREGDDRPERLAEIDRWRARLNEIDAQLLKALGRRAA